MAYPSIYGHPLMPRRSDDSDRTIFWVTVPILPGHYRPLGQNPSLEDISDIFQMGRIIALKSPEIIGHNRALYQSAISFVASCGYELTPTFYNLVQEDGIWSNFDMSFAITAHGRSSFLLQTKIFYNGACLALADFAYVLVDAETHRPKPLPGWFLDTHRKSTQARPMPKLLKKLEKPDGCATVPYIIQHSDLDTYQHFNSSKYLRLCIDVGHRILMSNINKDGENKNGEKLLPLGVTDGNNNCKPLLPSPSLHTGLPLHNFSLHGKLDNYLVERAKGLYLAQRSLGDKLEVSMWEDGDNPLVLHFLIHKGPKAVFQCTVKYRDLSLCSKL